MKYIIVNCEGKLYLLWWWYMVAEGTTKTRHSVVWTDKQKELVMEKLKNFPSLKDYNFDN